VLPGGSSANDISGGKDILWVESLFDLKDRGHPSGGNSLW